MNRITWMVLALAMCLGTATADAQRRKAEVAAMGGWQFGGRLTSGLGEFRLKDAWAFTGVIDINARRGAQVELMYNFQPTSVSFRNSTGTTELWDADLHYIQIGGLGYTDRGKVEPFGVATLGLTIFDPKDQSVNNETRFSFTLGAGAKIFPTERIGLRFEGRLMMTVIDGALGVTCGPGGCGGSVWGWGLAQGVISGGLILAF